MTIDFIKYIYRKLFFFKCTIAIISANEELSLEDINILKNKGMAFGDCEYLLLCSGLDSSTVLVRSLSNPQELSIDDELVKLIIRFLIDRGYNFLDKFTICFNGEEMRVEKINRDKLIFRVNSKRLKLLKFSRIVSGQMRIGTIFYDKEK